IFGMYDDACDMTAVFQFQVMPGASAVVTAPDAALVLGNIVPKSAFSLSRIYDGFIGRRQRHGSYPAAEPAVRYILPVAAAIGGLPETAARSAEIESMFIADAADDRVGPAAAEGTDQPVF